MIRDGDPIADMKRLLNANRYPGKNVRQRVLQREAEYDGDYAGRRQQTLDR